MINRYITFRTAAYRKDDCAGLTVSTRVSSVLYGLGLSLFWICCVAACFAQTSVRSGGSSIEAASVTPFDATTGGTIYEVKLNYTTDESHPIEVLGLGKVSGKGRLEVLTRDLTFKILDSASPPRLIGELSLKPTQVAAGNPSKDLPDASAFKAGRWFDCLCNSEEKLFKSVNGTLNHHFTEGINPVSLDKPYRLISTFRRLSQITPPFLGEIAIEVEYPVPAPGATLGFRISWLALESRKQSSTWIPATSPEILEPAGRYADDVVKEIIGK